MTKPFMCEFCYERYKTVDETWIHLNRCHELEIAHCKSLTERGVHHIYQSQNRCNDCNQVCVEVTRLRMHQYFQHSEVGIKQ